MDDDSMVRGWVRLALETTEFDLVGEAMNGDEAKDLLERRRPRLILLDYQLGGGVGTEFLRELRRSGTGVPAIMMTANPTQGFNEVAREAGAQGTLLKSGSVDDLIGALRAVRDGGEWFDHRHPRRPPGRAALTRREQEVLRMVAAGSTNRDVARELGVGAETVKTLLARTFAKLGVRRRAEAVSEAHKQGLI